VSTLTLPCPFAGLRGTGPSLSRFAGEGQAVDHPISSSVTLSLSPGAGERDRRFDGVRVSEAARG
jgi:hypothetical protein